METLKVGDVIQLKSYGPKMTIDSLVNGIATCIWFNYNKTDGTWALCSGDFSEDTIQKPVD